MRPAATAKSEPKREALKLSNLLALPTRLMSPTVTKFNSSAGGAKGSSSTLTRSASSGGSSKGLSKVPTIERSCMSEVRLDDILSGQHLPPLSAKEFEDYLVHVEHAPENLYFHIWLTDYTKKYRRWEAARQPSGSPAPAVLAQRSTLPGDLHKSLERALSTFLMGEPAQRGQSNTKLELELNLTAEVKEQIKHESKSSGDPSIFAAVDKEVTNMLEESMRRWLLISSGNRKRPWRQLRFPIHRFSRVISH